MSMFIPQSLAGGRYTVGELIGHGGMAQVHIGTDTRLGRTVAIKIMRSDLAEDSIFLTRFRREARAVAQLNNPNIVSMIQAKNSWKMLQATRYRSRISLWNTSRGRPSGISFRSMAR